MINKKKKIVFFCESVTLAHVARSRLLADHMSLEQYDIVFYCDNYYDHLFPESVYPVKQLDSTPPEKFIEWNLKSQPIWSASRIREYLAKDADILEEEQPDLVVGDMRHTLQISARQANVPYLNIMNGYWNANNEIMLPVPDVPIRRFLGTALAQTVFEILQPFLMIPHTSPFMKARQKYGLPKLKKATLPDIFCDCDYMAFLDLPEIIDMSLETQREVAIGPVLWAPEFETPDWWDEIPTDKPIVYINLGSSGDPRLLPDLVDTLARNNITLIVGTADKTLSLHQVHANVYAATYIPGDKACKLATVCISNGGSPTAMQALAEGIYSIGVCFNIDQLVNMHCLKQAGLGDYYYPSKDDLPKIEQSCLAAINAKHDFSVIAAVLNANDPYAKFNKLVDNILADREEKAAKG